MLLIAVWNIFIGFFCVFFLIRLNVEYKIFCVNDFLLLSIIVLINLVINIELKIGFVSIFFIGVLCFLDIFYFFLN